MREDGKIDYVEFPAGNIAGVKDFYAAAFGWAFTDYGPDYAAFDTSIGDPRNELLFWLNGGCVFDQHPRFVIHERVAPIQDSERRQQV